MGGSLPSISTNAGSLLDKVIYENFQMHLWLTLLSNQHLLTRFPAFMRQIVGEGEAENFAIDSPEQVDETQSIAPVLKRKASQVDPIGVNKFSKLLEYAVLAQASEDPKHILSVNEVSKNRVASVEKRKPCEGLVLQAIQRN